MSSRMDQTVAYKSNARRKQLAHAGRNPGGNPCPDANTEGT